MRTAAAILAGYALLAALALAVRVADRCAGATQAPPPARQAAP
jgi:hypothetical protein